MPDRGTQLRTMSPGPGLCVGTVREKTICGYWRRTPAPAPAHNTEAEVPRCRARRSPRSTRSRKTCTTQTKKPSDPSTGSETEPPEDSNQVNESHTSANRPPATAPRSALVCGTPPSSELLRPAPYLVQIPRIRSRPRAPHQAHQTNHVRPRQLPPTPQQDHLPPRLKHLSSQPEPLQRGQHPTPNRHHQDWRRARNRWPLTITDVSAPCQAGARVATTVKGRARRDSRHTAAAPTGGSIDPAVLAVAPLSWSPRTPLPVRRDSGCS